MYFICKCLNVSIKTKGSQLKNDDNDDIELNLTEQAKALFNDSAAIVRDLDNIRREQPGLIEVRNVGAWAIHRCCNCLMYTHALHADYGADLVLVNTNAITSEEEVSYLKESTNYSPVFRIVIDSNKLQLDSLEPRTKPSVSNLPRDSRLALASLEQQLEQAIRQQAHATDKKIQEFTKKQYKVLDKFKERAHFEHSFLARLIYSQQNATNSAGDSSTTTQPNESSAVRDIVDTVATPISMNNTFYQHTSDKSRNTVYANGDSAVDSLVKDANVTYDGEPLFLLEGMDDGPAMNRHAQVSDQESDTDDSGNEAVHIPRNHRGGHPTLAKSLPVTVPVFHSFNQRLARDDDDEQISRDPMDPHNIQASIKALAKSVHGDTVFGDLPRPRFSTQI